MRVLLAIDGSAHSAAAVEEVASRRWPAGTEVEVLTIVHTTTPLLLDPAFVMAAIYVETTQELWKHAPDVLAAAARRIERSHPNLSITTKAMEGAPRNLIVQEAADWGADLIVLGSHGHGPIRQALLGSVAAGVAADATCAVEVIRAGRQAVVGVHP
jgi:nucleotide-binding universal stress UspA family protein